MTPLDTAAVTTQVESLFARLQQELAGSDARQRCELAQAAVAKLQALRETVGASPALAEPVDAALNKAASLYETFHQELQYELEWASSGSAND